jgi:small-conductance mechanosensitive channel
LIAKSPHPQRALLLPLLLNLVLTVTASLVLHSWVSWTAPARSDYPPWVGNGLPFIQFMALAFLTDRLFRFTAERLTGSRRIPRLGLQLLTVVTYFTFLGASVGIVFGESVSAVLAASGIVGLAVGFALRGLLADVFSGIALNLDASLHTGHWIDLTLRGKEYSGRLVDIQWRTVVLADRAGNHILIPNSEFATGSILNRSLPLPSTEFGTSLPVSSQYDRGRVVQILENALDRAVETGVVLAQPAPYVRVSGLDAATGTLTYRMFYFLDLDCSGQTRAQSAVLSHAVDFLKAANMRLHPVNHTEVFRPSPAGFDRFNEPSARLRVLADVPLLSVLSQNELAALADRSTIILLSDGQYAMREGDDDESMVVVVEGRLAVQHGDRKVATLWPGECAGEMSLLTGSRRSADVVAEGQTVLMEIPKQALTPILQANPLQVERIATAVAKRRSAESQHSGTFAGVDHEGDDALPLIARIRKFFRLGI